MKPKHKPEDPATILDYRNSVNSSIDQGTIINYSCVQAENHGADADKTSEDQASAVSFANPIAFSARLSRAESIDKDELVSTVSFAASKRRRFRPERCRRRKNATDSVEESEEEHPLLNPYID